jgi:hypothetical protein
VRVLTLGDSWTYGSNEYGLDPAEISWPAQMAKKYNIEVVNLARGGSSNQRAARIGIEELCRDSNYDYVIFPLAPASRTEILKLGKWYQIWPGRNTQDRCTGNSSIDKIYTDFWHEWNDIQNTIMLSFYFIHSVQALGIPLFVSCLSLQPSQYAEQLSWILNYKNDNNFNSLNMPLAEFNISIDNLDRKLKSLKAIHFANLKLQSEYLYDVCQFYFFNPDTQQKYGYSYKTFKGHPDDAGYLALADYFAGKIGLT